MFHRSFKTRNYIASFKSILYAQRIDAASQTYLLLISRDNGQTWQTSIETLEQKITSVDTLFSYPSYIFFSTQTNGVFRYPIPASTPLQENFLQIPWASSSSDDLVNKLSAYFDHQLPLSGYSYYPEPDQFKNTTINFLGFQENTTSIPYSSHNGVDFTLPYDENVLATAPGLARYYYCSQCGHSIKIDHPNGYQTTYRHLQYDGLISNDPKHKHWVNTGDAVGRIGMTGNTSGPHLHLSVIRDKDENGSFDDYPDGLVDPFSWLNPYNNDPLGILLLAGCSGTAQRLC